MNTFVSYINESIDLETHLFSVLKLHSQNSTHWQKMLISKRIDEVVTDNLEETLFNLSKFTIDENLLRTKWQDFKPRNLHNTRCSFSSGTTGPQKYCLWSEDYIDTQADYLKHYLSEWGVRIQNAIVQGPTSVYKDVNERLVNRFGGDPYFIGLRVEGIKPLMEEATKKGQAEVMKVLTEYFAVEIEKTKKFLQYDERINFMRSAWMMLAPFEILYGDKKNISAVMVSGLGYTPQNHEILKQKFGTVVPSYGYFAFGDALGKYTNGNIDYYPPFPYAIFSVTKDNGEIAKYDEEGHPLFIVARQDLLLILKEENEYAKRARPCEEFPWDGIRNPYRRI